MGMNQVGIQLDFRENASTTAPKVVQALNAIGEAGASAGEHIQKAFEKSQFDSTIAKATEKIVGADKERDLKLRSMELKNQKMEQSIANSQQRSDQAPYNRMARGAGLISRTGSTVANLGNTGNALGAVPNVMETIGGAVKGLGPVGAAIGGGALVVGAVSMVVDQLTKQYEPFINTVMESTAAFGDLRDSAEANSLAFKTSLRESSEAAMQFGYTLEQGSAMFTQLAHGGIGRGYAGAMASNIFAYARGYGADQQTLAQSSILGARYGQYNVLGLAAGGSAVSGIGAGRYSEYLQGMTGIFEEALSKGVVRGFEEISGAMNFFSKMGPQFAGKEGARLVGQLSGSVTQATSLQKETDVLMYRAARSIAGSTTSYIDIMKKLEGGMTVDMFKSIYDQVKQTTGGNETDMVEMLRQMFGVNYTTASSLYQAGQPGFAGNISNLVASLGAPSAQSTEMKLLSKQEEIRLAIVEVGEKLLPAKTGVLDGMHFIVRALGKLAGMDIDEANKEAERKKFVKENESKFDTSVIGKLRGSDQGRAVLSQLYDLGITSSIKDIAEDRNLNQYQSGAQQLLDMLAGMNPAELQTLAGSGALRSTIQGIGNKDTQLQPEEVDELATHIQELTQAVKEQTREAVKDKLVQFTTPYSPYSRDSEGN